MKQKFKRYFLLTLATKVKQQQTENQHDNNNTKQELNPEIQDDPNAGCGGLDLSLKKEESLDEDLDLEDECDNDESELDDELEEDEEGKSVQGLDHPGSNLGSPVLVPHPRFPLGLNLPLPPPTSCWNPVSNPWMPQFRSPLNPFIPRKY